MFGGPLGRKGTRISEGKRVSAASAYCRGGAGRLPGCFDNGRSSLWDSHVMFGTWVFRHSRQWGAVQSFPGGPSWDLPFLGSRGWAFGKNGGGRNSARKGLSGLVGGGGGGRWEISSPGLVILPTEAVVAGGAGQFEEMEIRAPEGARFRSSPLRRNSPCHKKSLRP